MNPAHHKDDFFIAEYTLGLLDPDDIAQAHALLGADDDAVVCALQWEARLLALTDALTPLHPPVQLLDRIHDTLKLPRTVATPASSRPHVSTPASPVLADKPDEAPPSRAAPRPSASSVQHDQAVGFEPRLIRPDSTTIPAAPAPEPIVEPPSRVRTAPPDPTEAFRREAVARHSARPTLLGSLWLWRLLSGALAVLAIVLLLPENTFKHDPALSASLQAPATLSPTVVQVAIMQAPGTSSTPGWILTVDSRQNVILQPQVDIVIPESESMYLWTYNENLPQPRLLGVVDPSRPLTLPIEVTGEVAPGQIFEMTQEPNIAPPREPEGPILFIGRTVSLG